MNENCEQCTAINTQLQEELTKAHAKIEHLGSVIIVMADWIIAPQSLIKGELADKFRQEFISIASQLFLADREADKVRIRKLEDELTKTKAEAAVLRETLIFTKQFTTKFEHDRIMKALSSTAGQDLLDRLHRAEQREKQLREALQQVGELLEGIWIPDSDDWKQYVKACKLIRSVLEGAE